MTKLNLRSAYKKKYLEAIKNNIPTITAAPFYSYKTETVKASIFSAKNAGLFDLRSGIGSLNPVPGQHIFLDAIEIIPLTELKELIKSLQDKNIIVHLVTHLYYYETIKGLLTDPQLFFPQLLNSNDIKELKAAVAPLPEEESRFAGDLVNYADHWPAIAKLVENIGSVKKIAKTYLRHRSEINKNNFLKMAAKEVFGFYFSVLNKFKAVNKNIINKQFNIPGKLHEGYRSGKIDLKAMAEQIDPALWHFIKFGFLWLDEEKAELRVPVLLAENC